MDASDLRALIDGSGSTVASEVELRRDPSDVLVMEDGRQFGWFELHRSTAGDVAVVDLGDGQVLLADGILCASGVVPLCALLAGRAVVLVPPVCTVLRAECHRFCSDDSRFAVARGVVVCGESRFEAGEFSAEGQRTGRSNYLPQGEHSIVSTRRGLPVPVLHMWDAVCTCSPGFRLGDVLATGTLPLVAQKCTDVTTDRAGRIAFYGAYMSEPQQRAARQHPQVLAGSDMVASMGTVRDAMDVDKDRLPVEKRAVRRPERRTA